MAEPEGLTEEAETQIAALEQEIAEKLFGALAWSTKPLDLYELREKVLPQFQIQDAEPILYGAILKLLKYGVPVLGIDHFELGQSVDMIEGHLGRLHDHNRFHFLQKTGLERLLRRLKDRPCRCGKRPIHRGGKLCWVCRRKGINPQQESEDGCKTKAKGKQNSSG